jgi:hypothetical protein
VAGENSSIPPAVANGQLLVADFAGTVHAFAP